MSVATSPFHRIPGFCPDCGSILPSLTERGDVKCYTCDSKHSPDVFGSNKVTYTIKFNSRQACAKNVQEGKKKDKEPEEEGPVVERKCPSCGNERMSYATVQLRSADEGQTVFFTCTKCKYKESENS